jgi:ABC-2 type transport system permease protein
MTSILEQPARTAARMRPRPLLAAAGLCWRELLRFFRQRNRVVGAVGQPIIFWILFGVGLGPSFQPPGIAQSVSYTEYFFPGTLALIVLFTAIFTTISIIEDRHEGFLQSVLVAPIPRWSLVLGKVVGGALIALLEGLCFLALGLFVPLHFTAAGFALVTLLLFLVAIALTALGFVFAWRTDSTQGYHAVMSLILFPMWLLSGAFFPAESGWLYWIVRLNPLTYGVAGLRRLLYLGMANPPISPALPALATCWLITLLFAAGGLAAAWLVTTLPNRPELL